MKDKEKIIGFALSKVTTEKYTVIESNIPATGEEIGIRMNFHYIAKSTHKMVSAFSKFTFQADVKEFITIEGGCHFNIEPDDWDALLNNNKSKLTVPKDFLIHITTITVGTTRGILHALTDSTNFNKFYLPIINMADIITTDSIFDLNE